MKYIGLILGLILAAGCDDVAADVQETQAAVLGTLAGPRPFSQGIAQGYTTISAPGGEVPTRPNFGSPAWIGRIQSGYVPPSQCTASPYYCMLGAVGMFDPAILDYVIPSPSRLGYGNVMFWSRDNRWRDSSPEGYASSVINAWENEVPLRTSIQGHPQSGPVFQVNDLSVPHMNDPAAGVQLSNMTMDFYAHVTICQGPNMTGACRDWGYTGGGVCVYAGGVCHGDSACERDPNCTPRVGLTDFDIRQWTFGGACGFICPHASMRVEYGPIY